MSERKVLNVSWGGIPRLRGLEGGVCGGPQAGLVLGRVL